uniref:CN hydrolase domain-containing protein n=2 Tax=Lotharella globosa TaxID=91324 RepID=A0A7S4DM31_9EUKA
MGAEILLIPAAFTLKTGIAHWSVLLRARAIETQCFVLAAAQVGKHNVQRYRNETTKPPRYEFYLFLFWSWSRVRAKDNNNTASTYAYKKSFKQKRGTREEERHRAKT